MRSPHRAAAVLVAVGAACVPVAAWPQSPPPQAPAPFVGPTPDPAGTPCPGETEVVERHVSGPPRIEISPESAAYFKAHNPRGYVLFVLAVRLDGRAAIQLPADQNLDPALRSALIGYAQSLTVAPAIPNCARPGAIIVGHVAVPDGTVTFTMQMVPPTPPPASPSPLPSI